MACPQLNELEAEQLDAYRALVCLGLLATAAATAAHAGADSEGTGFLWLRRAPVARTL